MKPLVILPAGRKWRLLVFLFASVLLIVPVYLRLHSVTGLSDAPAYLPGDRVLVNRSAYDLRFPYTSRIVLTLAEPAPGDEMFILPPRGTPILKRLAAGPGDTIEIRDNHLILNDLPLDYERVDGTELAGVRGLDHLGQVVEWERGNGSAILISYTPGAGSAPSLLKFKVPADSYFVLGSNRDRSLDSRVFGPVPRNRILGKVVATW